MAYKRQSPVPVVEGGTDVQSLTTYAPICGGTSTTAPIQQATTGFSTSGYVLTSTGDSTLPEFQFSSGFTSTTYVDITPYTVLLTDQNLLVDSDDIGASTILLPDSPPNDGQFWTIKDLTGAADSSPITITTVSGITLIDGQTSFTSANFYESITVVWDSSVGAYSIVSQVNPAFISMPLSSPTTGFIQINGLPVFQAFGVANIFSGTSAGNFSLSGSNNTAHGYNSLNSLTSGSYNVGVGTYALNSLEDGTVNTAVGYGSMSNLVSGSSNCSVGENSFLDLSSGNYNLGMGQFAGANYTTNESSNILLNHGGVLGESNTLRIGSGTGTADTNISSAWIAGIQNVSVGPTANVVVNSGLSDQLGTALLTEGAGITITTADNVITISATDTATSTTFTSANPYVVLPTDDVILVDTSTIGGPGVVELIDSPSFDGQKWTIKDATGTAGSGNTITVQGVSGLVNIDNATTFVINTNFESITVVWSASQSQYYII